MALKCQKNVQILLVAITIWVRHLGQISTPLCSSLWDREQLTAPVYNISSRMKQDGHEFKFTASLDYIKSQTSKRKAT